MKKSLVIVAVLIAVLGMVVVSCGGSSEDCKTCTSYKEWNEGSSNGTPVEGTLFVRKFCGANLIRQEVLDGQSAGTMTPTVAVDGTKTVGALKVIWRVDCE